MGNEDDEGVARMVPWRIHMGVLGKIVSKAISCDAEGLSIRRIAEGRKAV